MTTAETSLVTRPGAEDGRASGGGVSAAAEGETHGALLRNALRLAPEPVDASALLLRRHPDDDLEVTSSDGPPRDDRLHDLCGLAELAEQQGGTAHAGQTTVRLLAVAGFDLAALVIEHDTPHTPALALWEQHLCAVLEQETRWRERRRISEVLVEIGMQIQAEEPDLDRVLETVVRRTKEISASDVCWLALADEDGGRLRLKVAEGAQTTDFQQLWTKIGRGVGGVAVTEARALYVPDLNEYDAGMPRWAHGVLQAEGLVSLLCAPILDGQRIVGALYAGMRVPTTFDLPVESSLIALATQAAIAIRNAGLYAELMDRNRTLETAETIHRRLTQASLAGAGLQQLVDEVATIVGGGVRLILGAVGAADVYSTGTHQPDAAPGSTAVPVVAGTVELGALVADGPDELPASGRQALEHGATVIALELVKRQATLEVEWRLRGELLDELLSSAGGELPEGLRQRADHAGVDTEVPRAIVLLAPHNADKLANLLTLVHESAGRSSSPNDLLIARRGEFVALAVRPRDGDSVRELALGLQKRAAASAIPTDVAIGTAGVDLTLGWRQATACSALAPRRGTPVCIDYRQLGPLRFVLDAPNSTEMRALVVEQLAPLARYGSSGTGADLLETLEVYLQQGGHNVRTAAACHIHISTLKYRLSRISEVLGCSLHDPQVRFQLTLAFEVRNVLKMLGLDPLS